MAIISEPREGLRRRNPLPIFTGLLLGCLVGSVGGYFSHRNYLAETSITFPSVDATVMKQTAQTLGLDASPLQGTPQLTANEQVVETAGLVFKSRGALTVALREAKVTPSPLLSFWYGDALEAFRRRGIQVEKLNANSLRLTVASVRAEDARALCQALLDYYTGFVHEHQLTNTARTRQQLEDKLVRVDKRLTTLERKLLKVADNRYRSFLETSDRPDAKVIKDIWRQRLLDQGSNKRVLDEMRKIRSEAEQDKERSPDEKVGEDWRARWGQASLENPRAEEESLPVTSKRSDLPSRLEMERVYEETLLLYHVGLLQYDFLCMWERLENFDFEIVDTITVHREPFLPDSLYLGLGGAALGALLGWLVSRGSA